MTRDNREKPDHGQRQQDDGSEDALQAVSE